MKHFCMVALAVGAALSACSEAVAGVFTDDMSKCIVRSSTEKDNITLVKWIFSAISANPEVSRYAAITSAERTDMNKATANLMQRLVTVDCRKESIAALKYEGSEAISASFATLGQVAVQQIFADPKVTAEVSALGSYIDDEKFKQLGAEAGVRPPVK